jgi:hypothetical protein
MIPRFLRTFLIISVLIIITTLYILYPLHTGASASTFQRTSSSSSQSTGGGIEEDLLAREDHWDKGGVEPDYPESLGGGGRNEGSRWDEQELQRVDDAGDDTGEGVDDGDNLEEERYDRTDTSSRSSSTATGGKVSGVHAHAHDREDELHKLETGGVIMSKLGNATAK